MQTWSEPWSDWTRARCVRRTCFLDGKQGPCSQIRDLRAVKERTLACEIAAGPRSGAHGDAVQRRQGNGGRASERDDHGHGHGHGTAGTKRRRGRALGRTQGVPEATAPDARLTGCGTRRERGGSTER